MLLNGMIIPVEVKSPTGKCDKHQLRMHKRIEATGSDVAVVSTKQEVDDLIAAITSAGYCFCDECVALRKMM